MTPLRLVRDGSLGEMLRRDRLEHRARRLEFVLERLRERDGPAHVIAGFERELEQIHARLDTAPAHERPPRGAVRARQQAVA